MTLDRIRTGLGHPCFAGAIRWGLRSVQGIWPLDDFWQQLTVTVEHAEMFAFEDAYRAAPPDFAAGTGMRYEWLGAALLVSLPAIDAKVFNRVLGLGTIEPATEEIIDRALAHFHESRVYDHAFPVTGDTQPAEVSEWLHRRGMQPIDSWVKVYRDNAPVQPIKTDLRVVEIGPDAAWHFADAVSEGFGSPDWQGYWLSALVGRPGWRIYVAYDGDTPAATGAMFVRDGVAWLGFGATRPEFRRRGAQGAIMAQRLQDGIDMGCKWFVTETWEPGPDEPNPSLNNMYRSGFQFAFRRLNYAYPE